MKYFSWCHAPSFCFSFLSKFNNKYIINKMEISVAPTEWLFHPLFPDRTGIWKCWSLWREKNRSTRRKTSLSRDENQQQTQPTYDVESGNRTRATLVGGECSHHCAIPAPLVFCRSLAQRVFLQIFRVLPNSPWMSSQGRCFLVSLKLTFFLFPSSYSSYIAFSNSSINS